MPTIPTVSWTEKQVGSGPVLTCVHRGCTLMVDNSEGGKERMWVVVNERGRISSVTGKAATVADAQANAINTANHLADNP